MDLLTIRARYLVGHSLTIADTYLHANTPTYDNNGNLTLERTPATKDIVTRTYDKENREIGVLINNRRATYTYDGDGLRRSEHEDGSSLTTLVWDGSDVIEDRT